MAATTDGRKARYEHRRDEILRAVTEYALDHGVADLTLRSAAGAVGVSHATLVHHFTTRDALVAEIVERILTHAVVPPVAYTADNWLAASWSYLRSEEGLRYGRLFVAVNGLSLYGEPAFAEALRDSVRRRVEDLAAIYVLLGCPPDEAPAAATSMVSRLRGLVTDLLLTGDDERVDAAFAMLQRDADRRLAEWAAHAAADRPAP